MKPTYNHTWHITVKADDVKGAMDAVWKCWEAWKDGDEPLGGCCDSSRGNRMDYAVRKEKEGKPE